MSPAPATSGASVRAPLRTLPALLRDEPTLGSVLGRSSATLAVPASTEAERLAHDLGAYLGDEAVELFPAWETLPFERVSPGVETMGRRMQVLWRLRDAERSPAVVVASVRALVQRIGPHVADVEPVVVRPG